MTIKVAMGTLAIAAIAIASPTFGDDDDGKGRWWHGQSDGEYWEGPCKVKIETKGGQHMKEIKCKDGIGAGWHGEWKKEYQDGPCQVKVDAKRDEYKEEVKCD